MEDRISKGAEDYRSEGAEQWMSWSGGVMDWGWVIGSKGGEWVELGSCEVEEERNNE